MSKEFKITLSKPYKLLYSVGLLNILTYIVEYILNRDFSQLRIMLIITLLGGTLGGFIALMSTVENDQSVLYDDRLFEIYPESGYVKIISQMLALNGLHYVLRRGVFMYLVITGSTINFAMIVYILQETVLIILSSKSVSTIFDTFNEFRVREIFSEEAK